MSDKNLNSEVVAAIIAAVQNMLGTEVQAVKIKRNENWSLSVKVRRN